MSTQSQDNNKRIAKNTLFLYMRMGITMFVQLYTSRIVLNTLGVEDYGIYNVVGAFIVAFTFIQTPITSSIQRFLNYELGRKNGDVNIILNLSLLVYACLSAFFFIIIEIAGVLYIDSYMILPASRLYATHVAFQMSLLGLVVSIMKSPFEALIIAHERMSYYAYISILEVFLKLLNALFLTYIAVDKLELYAINHLLILILISFVLILYCRRSFRTEVLIRKIHDYSKLKEILRFSGWSIFSGIASMTATNGLNILLNAFFGVVVNAAMGVASQVNATINQFVSNFQKAFNPQIVKLYAAGSINECNKLVSRSSRFSYLLLFMIVCPAVFNIDFILKLWLKEPPNGTSVFCVFLMIWQLLESLMAPMWTAVHATGDIKKYHLTMSPIILSVILISYITLKYGLPAYSVVVVKCSVDIVLLVVRTGFVKRMTGFNVADYIKTAITPIFLITLISITYYSTFNRIVSNGWDRLLIGIPLFFVLYSFLVFVIGMQANEKKSITHYLYGQILKKIMQKVQKTYSRVLFLFFRLFPLQNKIIATTMRGRKYGDNPQFIIETVHKLDPDISIVWLCNEDYQVDTPSWIKRVSYYNNITRLIYELSTAKVWINSHRFESTWRKRPGQFVIETWHGGLGLKKIEGDVPRVINTPWEVAEIRNTCKISDLFISQSDHLSSIYRRAFGYKGKILKCGYPKNDCMFTNRDDAKRHVQDLYGLDTKKILLYAPTMREGDQGADTPNMSPYQIDCERLYNVLLETFRSDWVIFVKWHPCLANTIKKDFFENPHVVDVTDYNNMQELIKASDAVISDYSSCIFDAALLGIPCFTYATDFEEYKSERGVYFDMHELPFPYATNNDELIHNIQSFDSETNQRRWNDFVIRTGLHETGTASVTIANLILNFIKYGKYK